MHLWLMDRPTLFANSDHRMNVGGETSLDKRWLSGIACFKGRFPCL